MTQKQLRKTINRDGTFNQKKAEKFLSRYADGSSGFHAGGFFLGFLLGLIGVLIAYLIKDDKKKNRVMSHEIRTDYGEDEGSDGQLEGVCNVTKVKAINDSLFEVKAGALMYVDLYDSTKTITGGTYYHYLMIENNKLVELPNKRTFGFTKYVKMDDSYLNGCYNLLIGASRNNEGEKKDINQLTPEILRYMKNEIYADYRYEFKDKRWKEVFQNIEAVYDRKSGEVLDGNKSVDDSLTVIDKYNINWINQKLKGTQEKGLASR